MYERKSEICEVEYLVSGLIMYDIYVGINFWD